MLAPLASGAAEAHGEEHEEGVSHTFSIFVGLGAETKRDEPDEEAFVLGLEYYAMFHEQWGIGAVAEVLASDTARDYSVIVPVRFVPGGQWRIFAGPGIELGEKDDHFLFRLGFGYEFEPREHLTLEPSLIADFIDGGAITYIGGVGIGFKF